MESHPRHGDGFRFVRRMYLPRTVGLALGAVCIGTVLWSEQAGMLKWLLLGLTTLAWSHLALWLGMRSADPYRAELRNLTVDSALGGAWIALIGFNLLPSVVLASMLSMDKIAVGGFSFLVRCGAAMAIACALAMLAPGFAFRPDTSMAHIVGSLPLLVVYPVMVGVTTYRLARRVRGQNQLLAELSRTDPLSRLLNRRGWEEAVSAEFQRCSRNSAQACLLMIDIDHFKAVNDRYGHPVGDEVIRGVAKRIRDTVREQDWPGRYGGEEFGVVLPDTDAAGASVIAERLRRRIEAEALEPEHGVQATVSVGIARFEADDRSFETWIQRADRALYAAKAQGRNRSALYEPALPASS